MVKRVAANAATLPSIHLVNALENFTIEPI
jgi:hypothetical protein